MINNEQRYQETKLLYREWKKRTAELKIRLKNLGYTRQQIKQVIDPLVSFYLGFAEEAAEYERRTKRS